MSAMATRQPIVRAREEGERRWFYGGGLHIWKATAAETDGAFLLFEDRMDHGKVTPLHIHPDSDETMIVLEGEILMHLDGADHAVGAGGIASALRGVPHAFMVSGAEGRASALPAHPGLLRGVLSGCQRTGGDDDDREIGAGPVDMARVQASAQKNGGIEILGPPPFRRLAPT